MRRLVVLAALAGLVAACGSSHHSASPATPPSHPTARAATVAPSTARPAASPAVQIDRTYAAFLRSLCQAFAARNAQAVQGSLMYYQYNSGLRWGMLGDGEGHTDDPALVNTWLSTSSVRCRSFTPAVAGHGTLMTSGWSQPGPWGLIEMDVINGHWKINDFTFGGQGPLAHAMQVDHPIMVYRG